MAIAQEFEYLRPSSLEEAGKLLAEYQGRARVLAGGTDLIAMIMDDLVKPEVLIDIKDVAKLGGVAFEENALRIGALASFSEVRDFPATKEHFPVLHEMIGMVASFGLRNRATLVGNICSAVPCCDTGPVLLTYDAEVYVQSAKGERSIPIGEWFRGPRRTACGANEVASRVVIPLPDKKTGGSFVKLKRYRGEDLAQSSVTVLALQGDSYRVAFGAVAPTPVRGRRVEACLEGQPLSDALIEEAKKLVAEEITPITDIRSSKEYRLYMTEVMLERGLRAAVSRREGKGPAYGVDLI